MNFYIDVDGVVRQFIKSIGMEKKHTSWILLPQNIWDAIDDNPKKYLYDCDIYEDIVKYVKSLMKFKENNIFFLTNQCGLSKREYWTERFIKKHFGNKARVLFTKNFQEKIDLLNNNKHFVLVDDYPNFYEKEGFENVVDRIILVERKWNYAVRHHYCHFISDIMKNYNLMEG